MWHNFTLTNQLSRTRDRQGNGFDFNLHNYQDSRFDHKETGEFAGVDVLDFEDAASEVRERVLGLVFRGKASPVNSHGAKEAIEQIEGVWG